MKAVYLTDSEMKEIEKLLNNEIEMNEDYLSDINNDDEKEAWKETIKFDKQIREKFRLNPKNKFLGYGELVVQELTAEQEDYLIECGLEMIREARQNE